MRNLFFQKRESTTQKLTSNLAANKAGISNEPFQFADDLVGAIRVDIFIVVASEESAAVLGPEVLLNLLDGRCHARVLNTQGSNDVQPRDNGPKAIFLTNVVTASSETLLAADGELLCIEEGAEELPAGGHFIAV